MFDISTSYILILVVFAFAGVLHGLTGIGITLIATTALATIYPLSQALILAVLPCLVINAVVFLNGGNIIYYIKKYWLLAVMSFIGSLIGTKLLFIIDQNWLLIGLATIILFYVATQWLGKSIRLPNNTISLITSGTLAGVAGGATNAMSPILIMYLLSATEGQENVKIELVKASNFCYLVGKIAQFIMLWQAIIVLPKSEFTLIGWATIASLLCLYIGFYFRQKIPQKMFKNLILLILLVLGIKALFKGLGI